MRTIEREDELTTLNKQALRIARDVADSHGKLMAGGLSNSTVFVPNDKQAAEKVEEIFKVTTSTQTRQQNLPINDF